SFRFYGKSHRAPLCWPPAPEKCVNTQKNRLGWILSGLEIFAAKATEFSLTIDKLPFFAYSY
ncbi:MAG: hypothetical protein IJL34_00635, partial [Treponema sp.]|nr:hypothetical protein [Treponema sp.]